ncbi:MAG: hypothetical protein KBS60_01195 [Phascolarctobacterium sp.]|nr:hypothetical protein [Candidatus Phascolarctobacterium caballi]
MAERSLKFSNYNKYNDTTQGQYQEYSRNQNSIVTEMAEALLWQPSTMYSAGQVCMSTKIPKGKWAVCSVAGTSGQEEPDNWDSTTQDGTVTWVIRPISVVVDGSIIQGGTNPVTAAAIYLALSGKQNIADPAALAIADRNGNEINFTGAGIKLVLGNTAVARAIADKDGNPIDGIVDEELDGESTHAIQNKAVYEAIGADGFQFTASQQAALTYQAAYGGGINYLYTQTGLPEQKATLKTIVQKLINLSHSHTLGSWNCNCNCDCDCTCDCSGGE